MFAVVDATQTGDALLDQVLDSVGAHQDGNSYRQYEYAAKALSGHMGRPIPQVFDSLVADGLATAHDKHLLGPPKFVKLVFPDKAERATAKARTTAILDEVLLAADLVSIVMRQQSARHLRTAGSLGGSVG